MRGRGLGRLGGISHGAKPPLVWHDLSPYLQANWSNYGGGYPVGAFSKDEYGIVRLDGLIHFATPGSYPAFNICDLPVGFRPVAYNRICSGIGSYSGGNLAFRVDVGTNGTVGGSTTSGVNFTGDYISLSTISFPTLPTV